MKTSIDRSAFRTIALMAGFLVAAGPAAAGCALEITFKNDLNVSATLDIEQTKVRVMGPGTNPIPSGPYVRFMDESVTIPANGSRMRHASLAQGCNAGPRDFKFFFAADSQVYRVNKFVVTAVDKKFNVRIKD